MFKLLASALWSSFITAAISTAVIVFLVDAEEWLIATPLHDWNRIAAYSSMFFCIWLISLFSSLLALYFLRISK